MTAQSTSNLQYSWSLDLREVLLQDEFTISWLTMRTDLLIDTDIGSAEAHRLGPTTIHFIEVPTPYLISPIDDADLIVLELTRAGDVTLAHLRPAWSGTEPIMDMAQAEVPS